MSVPCGFYWTEGIRGLGWAVDAVPTLKGGSTIGIPSPPAIVFPSGLVATPDIRDAERLQGFPADWTKPAERVTKRGARWKMVGNAVTVGAAEWIGRRLAKPGVYDSNGDAALLSGRPWPRAAWNVGHGRFSAPLSSWPMNRRTLGLAKFLRFEVEPLSPRATAGFLERASRSTLHFPPGFLQTLESHLAAVRSRQNAAS
jgi:DNA (cytosine-5)-methyltransferase 1